jgi:hypothetical protein
MGFTLFVLFVVVAIVVVVFTSMAAKKRREALAKVAADNGLEFSPNDPFDLPNYLAGIDTFNQGSSRKAENVIHGQWRGRKVIAFDYQYTTGSGKNRHTHQLSACLQPVGVRVPGVVIRPETFLDKAAGFVGFEDIDFESDEFSREFFVKSDDRKFAYDICHPQMMSWLLANGRGWSVQLVDSSLVLTTGSRWSPEEFAAALYFSARFFELIPEFVWKEYRDRAGAN